MGGIRLIPEDQKDHVRQTLLSFLEEPDFTVSWLVLPVLGQEASRNSADCSDCSTSTIPPGFRGPYRTPQTVDFASSDFTPEPPDLPFPSLDQCYLFHHCYGPSKYTVDDQCSSKRMEECQDPDRGASDEVLGRGIHGTGIEGDGVLGTE